MSLEQLLFGVGVFIGGEWITQGCFVLFSLFWRSQTMRLKECQVCLGLFSYRRSTADPFFKWCFFCPSVSSITSLFQGGCLGAPRPCLPFCIYLPPASGQLQACLPNSLMIYVFTEGLPIAREIWAQENNGDQTLSLPFRTSLSSKKGIQGKLRELPGAPEGENCGESDWALPPHCQRSKAGIRFTASSFSTPQRKCAS